MSILNPLTNKLWTSQTISTNATGDQFANAISGYYSSVWGASITVARTMYDGNETITTDIKKAAKTVFEITAHRSLKQATTSYVNFAKMTTKSTFSMLYPSQVQLSTPPI